MKLAIHKGKNSFSERWIAFCEENHISFKIVDCYRSDIVQQLHDCNALMWHFSQNDPKALLFAKELLYSIQLSGKRVFPDFNTVWHFDDKVGQKYLLEAIGAPIAPTWIFYERAEAIFWVEKALYPKVFKLRNGAGSQNVKLVRNKRTAHKLVNKAFMRGFPAYDPLSNLKERWRKYKLGKTNLKDIAEGIVRFLIPPPYATMRGRERGYVYFQEFIPGNDHDIRVVVIGDKAFAIKRLIRKNDFRASGSGEILYEKKHFNDHTVQLAFQMAGKLKSQCAAFDFVYLDESVYVIEVSFGFVKEVYDPCPGYWDKNLIWHEGRFNPYGWMVENLLKRE